MFAEKKLIIVFYYCVVVFRGARQRAAVDEKDKTDTDRDDFIERVRWTSSASSAPSSTINASSYIQEFANLCILARTCEHANIY